MSAWSTLLAISGFHYRGGERAIAIKAPAGHRCFWSTATGWGTFHVTAAGLTLHVDHGTLRMPHPHRQRQDFTPPTRTIKEGEDLRV